MSYVNCLQHQEFNVAFVWCTNSDVFGNREGYLFQYQEIFLGFAVQMATDIFYIAVKQCDCGKSLCGCIQLFARVVKESDLKKNGRTWSS